MAKYRRKIEHVEAVQMQFGKNGWPAWLNNELSIKDGQAISEGDYIVRDEDGVAVLTAAEFESEFESSRAPKHHISSDGGAAN